MTSRISDSIRVARAADAPAIAAVHVGAWRETYAGLVPAHVLSGLSVDRRTEAWGRIISKPEAFNSSAVFVAEREGAVVGFGCCGLQRAENLNAQGYDGEISAIYLLRSFQRCGLGLALMSAIGQELQRRGRKPMGSWREPEGLPILRETRRRHRWVQEGYSPEWCCLCRGSVRLA